MRTADCGLRAAGYGGPYIDERPTTNGFPNGGPYIDERFPLWYNNLSMRKGGIYETETRYTYIVFGAGCGLGRFFRQPGFF